MRINRFHRRTIIRRTILLVIATVAAAGIVFGALWIFKDTNPIPNNLRTKLSFSPLVIPLDSSQITSRSYEFSKAEDKTQILSYILDIQDNQVTVSEYVQPSEFTDIPEYKDRFLTNVIQQYATVQTANGTIYLGRLSQQDGQQLGVMIEKGLLVFMRPSAELDEMTWRLIGDRFTIVRGT